MTVTNVDILNALMAQKEELMARTVKATDPDELQEVLDCLQFVSDLWKACGYGYKADEVVRTIVDRTERLIAGEQQELSFYRKNGGGL